MAIANRTQAGSGAKRRWKVTIGNSIEDVEKTKTKVTLDQYKRWRDCESKKSVKVFAALKKNENPNRCTQCVNPIETRFLSFAWKVEDIRRQLTAELQEVGVKKWKLSREKGWENEEKKVEINGTSVGSKFEEATERLNVTWRSQKRKKGEGARAKPATSVRSEANDKWWALSWWDGECEWAVAQSK